MNGVGIVDKPLDLTDGSVGIVDKPLGLTDGSVLTSRSKSQY